MIYRTFLLLSIGLLFSLCASPKDDDSLTLGKRISIDSKILDESREIYVYEPSGYEELKNIPVIFVTDAFSQFQQTATTVDYLSDVGQGNDALPPALVIGITNPNRNFDLTPVKGILGRDSLTLQNTGGGALFLDFITKELIPFIDEKYNTCQHRTLIGHSLGGLLVFQALLEKRDFFTNYISLDPALGFADGKFLNKIYNTLNEADLSAENLYVATANTRPTNITLEELAKDSSRFLALADKPNHEFITTTARDKWKINITRQHYESENHFSVPLKATQDALKLFFDFHPFPEIYNYFHPNHASKSDLLARYKDHYQFISQKMGCEQIPQENYLNAWAWGISGSGRTDLSQQLFDYKIELYPNRSSVYANYGYFLRQQGKHKEALIQLDKSLELQEDREITRVKREIENLILTNNQ